MARNDATKVAPAVPALAERLLSLYVLGLAGEANLLYDCQDIDRYEGRKADGR
jgi:hypothetical protein